MKYRGINQRMSSETESGRDLKRAKDQRLAKKNSGFLELFRFRYRIQHGIDNLLPGHVAVVFNERIATEIEDFAG